MLVVPGLVYLFKLDERTARATTVFAILPMVIASGIFYSSKNYIDWSLSIKCLIGGIIGGIIGVKLLKKLPEWVLKLMLILLMIYVSITMIMG